MSLSKARANEVGRTPTTNDIVLFRSPTQLTKHTAYKTGKNDTALIHVLN